jgi:tetratricopeptide (TPR) repeat protein
MLTLAGNYGDLREWSQMVGYYERAFGVEPGLMTDLIINHQYGWALVQIDRQDAARAAYQKMLELEPGKRARGHRSLAILALYQGRLGDASRELEEARRLDETSGTINSAARDVYYLAEGIVLLGRTEDANSRLTRAADLSGKARWTQLSLRLATLLARIGRFPDASRIVAANRKQAQAGDPYERSDLLRAEGEIALGQGRTAEALELLKQAVVVQPWILTQTSLARAMLRAGQQEEALAAYEAIIARGPEPWEGQAEWAVSHLALARLYERAGRLDDARRTCEHLQDAWKNADTNLPPVRELSATLARLGGARSLASAPPK